MALIDEFSGLFDDYFYPDNTIPMTELEILTSDATLAGTYQLQYDVCFVDTSICSDTSIQ